MHIKFLATVWSLESLYSECPAGLSDERERAETFVSKPTTVPNLPTAVLGLVFSHVTCFVL